MIKTRLLWTVLPAIMCVFSSHAYTWDENEGVTWNKTFNKETHQLTDASNGIEKAKDWMSDLPDNMFVAHVSIPGTHDSATGSAEWKSIAAIGIKSSQTQMASMAEMFDRGIRAWDFRPGLVDGELWCNHGIAQLNLKLYDAIKLLTDKLKDHPNEFFIIHLFRGNVYRESDNPAIGGTNKEADRNSYNQLLKKLFEEDFKDFVVDFDPTLKVGDVRGKMILFRRDRIDFVNLTQAANIENWVIEFPNEENPAKIRSAKNSDLVTRLHVQDISSGNDNVVATKKNHSENLLKFCQQQETPLELMDKNGYYTPEWVFNFTSIQNTDKDQSETGTNDYIGGASQLNPHLNTCLKSNGYLGRGPIGVFFSDWVLRTKVHKLTYKAFKGYEFSGDERAVEGSKLVYYIIENNFTGGDNAPVVRFALPEDKEYSWGKMPENPFIGKKYFLRNVGASEEAEHYKYLAGGAAWGAHAVANYSGHLVEFVAGTNGVNLKTSYGLLQNKSGEYYMDGGDGTDFRIEEIPYEGRTCYALTGVTSYNRLQAYSYANNPDVNNAYFDRPKYYVHPNPEADNTNPFQLWELIEEGDRMTRMLRKANESRGMDATWRVPGYSFGNGDAGNSEWKIYSKGDDANVLQVGTANGGMWIAFNEQVTGYKAGEKTVFSFGLEVEGLPKGKYNLSFQCVAYQQNVKFSLNGGEPEAMSAENGEWSAIGKDGNGNPNADHVNKIGAYFQENETNGQVSRTFTLEDGAKFSMKFERTDSRTSPTFFCLDNIVLTYYGDNAQPIDINLSFPFHYNTLMLPFDHSIPDGLVVREATGVTTHHNAKAVASEADYHVMTLSDPVDQIKANIPYIVEHTAVPKGTVTEAEPKSRAADATEDASKKVYTFTGHPLNYKDVYYNESGLLAGSHEGRSVANHHYQIEQRDTHQRFHMSTTEHDDNFMVGERRAYVTSKYQGLEHAIVYFEAPNDDVQNGLEDILADNAGIRPDTSVDVFTTNGVMVKTQVRAADVATELPTGIYIVRDGNGNIMKICL